MQPLRQLETPPGNPSNRPPVPHRRIDPAIARVERRAALLALVVGAGLMGVKFVAYALTGSAAVFSDALESIVNVLAGIFALYAIVLAHRPADDEHPYGHGKVEFLAAGFEGGMILLAAMVIVWRAAEAILHGPQVQNVDLGLILMVVAMVVNGGVGVMLVGTGRRHGSIALEADGRHLLSDAVTSIAVLAALAVVKLTGWAWADPLAALLVAGYLAWVAVGLLRRSAAGLMDEQDSADNALIRGILDRHVGRGAPGTSAQGICSYHKLRHRHAGRYHWVDFHMVVPAHWDVRRGHEAASAIEGEIEQALGVGDATAHVEPCDAPGCGCRGAAVAGGPAAV